MKVLILLLILVTSFVILADHKATANEHFNIRISPTFTSDIEAFRLNATFQNHPNEFLAGDHFPVYQYLVMLNHNSTLCPLNNCYVYFQDLELRKNTISESYNLEGNLKIGNETSKGFLTRIYHLFGDLEIRESLTDKVGNTVFYMEGEIGLSDGSEFEFIPDVNYDISTKATKLSFPNNLPVLELKAYQKSTLDWLK